VNKRKQNRTGNRTNQDLEVEQLSKGLARELKIQEALEEIRSAALSMQHSDQLYEVVKIIFDQCIKLGLKADGVSLNIYDGNAKDFNLWVVTPDHDYPAQLYLPYLKNAVFDRLYVARQDGIKFLQDTLNERTLKPYFNHIRRLGLGRSASNSRREKIRISKKVHRSTAFTEHGWINIFDFDGMPVPEADNDILKRIAQVFQQAYVRFLDLKRAEEQTREAQIAASLERIRSASMAMQHSEELNQLIATVFEELDVLGIDAMQCKIILIDQDKLSCETWLPGKAKNKMPNSYHIPYNKYTFYKHLIKSWQTQIEYIPYVLKGRAKSAYESWLFQQTDWKNIPVKLQKSMRNIKRANLYGIPIKPGIVEIASPEIISADQLNIIRRFAKIFEQSFTRFLDLKNVESQALEAQIEASLERVRSKAMAMHNSTEVKGVVSVIHEQLLSLKIPSSRCYIYVINEDTVDLWLSVSLGENIHQFQLLLDWEDIPTLVENHRRWSRGDTHAAYDFKGAAVKKWYDGLYQVSKGLFPKPEKVPKYQQNIEVFSRYGGLGIVNQNTPIQMKYYLPSSGLVKTLKKSTPVSEIYKKQNFRPRKPKSKRH